MPTNQEVVLKVGTELKGSGKPFDRLSQNARDAESQINQRLGALQKRLDSMSKFDSLVKDRAIDFFGISKADKQVNRLSQTIQDNLARLERKAINFKVGMDPAPMQALLRRLEGQASQVKKQVEGLAGASFGGFSRAAGGATDVGRGLLLLGGGNADIQKTVEQLFKFQAAMDLLRGGKEIVTGLVSGFVNLQKAIGAMGKASELAAALAKTASVVQTATAGQAAAEAANTTALDAAVAETAKLTAANEALAASHRQVAAAAGQQAAAEAAAQTVGASGSSVGPSRLALLAGFAGRAGLGAAVGYGVGGMFGHEYLGAGIGAAGAALGPRAFSLAGRGLMAGGTALAGTGIGSGVLGGIGAYGLGTLALGGTAALATAGGASYLIDRQMHGGQDVFGAYGAYKASNKKMAAVERQQEDQARRRAATETRLEAERPFRDQMRDLTDQQDYLTRDMPAIEQEGNRRYLGQYRTKTAQESFQESLQRSVAPHAKAGALAETTSHFQALQSASEGEGFGSAESQAGLMKAQGDNRRAQEEVKKIQGQIADKEKEIAAHVRTSGSALAEKADLQQRLVEAQQRGLESQQNLVQAEHQSNQAQRDKLATLRDQAAEAHKFYQEQARQQQQRNEENRSQLGLMNPMKLRSIRDVGRRLSQGKKLNERELGILQGAPGGIFGDKLHDYGLKQAEKNPYIAEIMKLSGAEQKQQGFQQQAQQFGAVKAQFNQQIEALIKIDDESLAKKLEKEVVPKIKALMIGLENRMKEAVERQLSEMRNAQRAGSNTG